MNSNERLVILPPDHSRWWLISPGALFYYDKIILDKRDFERTINAEGSTYHELIYDNFNWIIKNSDVINPKLLDVPSILHDNEAKAEALNIANEILNLLGSKKGPALITYKELKLALINAYRIWIINLKEKQERYLYPDEPYEEQIRNEQLPESIRHLNELSNVPAYSLDDYLQKNPDVFTVLTYLLGFAKNMLYLSELGYHIYEPLLQEYFPFIEILLKYKMSKFISDYRKGINFPLFLEVYRSKIKKIQAKPLVKVDLITFFKKREDYKWLRKKLLRLDILLEYVKQINKRKDLDSYEKEINALVKDIKEKMKVFELSEWGVSVFASFSSLLISIMGQVIALPFLDKKIKSFIEEFCLYAKGVTPASNYFVDILDHLLTLQMRKSSKVRIYPKKIFNFWI